LIKAREMLLHVTGGNMIYWNGKNALHGTAMRRAAYLCAIVGILLSSSTIASARLVAQIDLSSQRMYVQVNGVRTYSWKISTARRGYHTPVGSYRPKRLKRMHYSRKYHWSPMPYSIFFKGGYAIHGSNQIKRLGRPASHGCVRLHPRNAAKLFQLVRRHGMRNTWIRIRY